MDSRCKWTVATLALVLAACVWAGDSSEEGTVDSSQPDGRVGKDGGGRSVLADIAREMVMRSATSSQVLSLNLTNLLILLILKALLFGAGVFSFGFLKNGVGGGGYPGALHGRSEEQARQAALDEPELLLMLSFLLGDAERRYDCLYRVACEQPKRAREYAAAARAVLKGASMLHTVVPYDAKYETIAAELQKAADFGLGSNQCSQRYSCDSAGNTADKPAD